jgi:hypothetical protein
MTIHDEELTPLSYSDREWHHNCANLVIYLLTMVCAIVAFCFIL